MATPRDAAATPIRGPRRGVGERSPWWLVQLALLRRPRLESGWASEAGPIHDRNQDAVRAAAPLFAVADGVGGGVAGELASSELLTLAEQVPPDTWREPSRLAAWLVQADIALTDRLAAVGAGGRSASTLVAAWVDRRGDAILTHVGDCRALRLDRSVGRLQPQRLTVDQTYAAVGEPSPPGGRADDPARMVGSGAVGEPPVRRLRLEEGSWLVLASDGLHRHLDDAALAAQCDAAPVDEPLSRLARRLAERARAAGSRDDVSVLLLRLNPRLGARRAFWLALAITLALAVAAWVALPWITAPAASADGHQWITEPLPMPPAAAEPASR